MSKKIHLEVLRILACFFVIYHHTYIYPETQVSIPELGITFFWGSFCCFAVPAFFMISGALLLGKEETIKEIWKKRVLKIAITLLLFSFVYYMRLVILGYRTFDIVEFVKELYSTHWNYSYWYLYNYIGYLICLPLLRSMVKNMSAMCFRYTMLIAIAYASVIPVLEYFVFDGSVRMNGYLEMPVFTEYCLIYPLLGYYIEHIMDVEKAKKYLIPLWLINLSLIGITCYMTYQNYCSTGEFTQSFYEHAMILNCITIYLTIKCLIIKIDSTVIHKAVCSLGGATLGIYLLHILIREWLWNIFDYLRYDMHVHYIVAVFLFDIVIFVVGYMITIVLKRIPLIKKIIS